MEAGGFRGRTDPACCVDPGDGGAKVLLTRTMLTESGGLILQDWPFALRHLPPLPKKAGVFSLQNDARRHRSRKPLTAQNKGSLPGGCQP